MACGIKLWSIASIVLFVLKLQVVVGGHEPQVPCYFIFGDSLVDNGNNNDLKTTAKVNYLPYGIDFRDGPTGRFTNGRTTVDIISQLLGFDDFIPPFATARGNAILKGVNYGSGGSGIRDETGKQLGERIPLDEQLRNHEKTVLRINELQGNKSFTKQYLSKCLYTVGMGSNDYINNYLNPQLYLSSRLYTPDRFAQLLIKKYHRQLKKLYKLGARKVAVFGLGPVGCAPAEIAIFGTNGSVCVDKVNYMVQLFDERLKPLVQDLNIDFDDAKFTFINITSISSGDPTAAGITLVNGPCCTVSNTTGLCIPDSVPCSNRTQHLFYDAFHTTEISNLGIAARTFNPLSPFDVYPVDIRHLAEQ